MVAEEHANHDSIEDADRRHIDPRRVRAARGRTRDTGRSASAQAAYRACFDSADYREGVAAFLGKRKPRFEGR
jgi:enoyl-CoA hydratase/carnithine racemase